MSEAPLKASYDAVVVGSGHNGLVVAAYLGLAGKSVLVLEQNSTIGGATASERVFPDFDARLSKYSYLVSLFPQKVIDDLGLKFRTARRRTASFTPYVSKGEAHGLVISNVDPCRSQDSMREMTGSDTAWARYMRLMELEGAIADHVWPSLLKPLKRKSEFALKMQSSVELEAWRSFVEEPLGNVIERYADHDALRGLLMTDGKIGVFTHAHDLGLLQNRCFLYHVVGGGDGEWKVPVGGMSSIVDSLLTACEGSGVETKASSPVSRVERDGTGYSVSFTHEGKNAEVAATYVLVNAGPRSFARLFGKPWESKPSNEGSVVKINMLLTGLPHLRARGVTPEEAFAGSFHIDEGYEQMKASYEAARGGSIPNPAPGEMYCHTLTDPSILSDELKSKGFQTMTLFGLDMPYRLFENDHDNRRNQVLSRFLEGLDRLCDGQFIDCIAKDREGRPCIEIKTPQDLEREVGLDQGNIFHNELSWFFAETDGEVGAWGVETEYPNVFLAGSSAKRGGAVSGIPGHNAAMRILEPG